MAQAANGLYFELDGEVERAGRRAEMSTDQDWIGLDQD